MTNFSFRLQKVLEYREMLEDWAKKAYLEAQGHRLQADGELAALQEVRSRALSVPYLGLKERLTLENYLMSLDEDEHQQRLALQVLIEEEAKALGEWIERKRDLEALLKLKNHAFTEWSLEMNRKEQSELDEWAVLRRGA